jgi:X-domain of DnaJ-containing
MHRKLQLLCSSPSPPQQGSQASVFACRYDKNGKAAVSGAEMMDPATVFGMAFGSDNFEDYVGQLAFATVAGMGVEAEQAGQQLNRATLKTKLEEVQKVRAAWAPENGRRRCPERMQSADGSKFPGAPVTVRLVTQPRAATCLSCLVACTVLLPLLQERIAKLVPELIKKVQLYVDGHKEEFKAWARKEAERLADGAFGEPMLHTIGCGRVWVPSLGTGPVQAHRYLHAGSQDPRPSVLLTHL